MQTHDDVLTRASQLIDSVPYADGELSNVDRRRVLMLIKEEMDKQEIPPQQQETETISFKDEILQNTYNEFVKNQKLPSIETTTESIESQLQNDKNQKINLSLLQTNAKPYWTAYITELDQHLQSLQHEKKEIQRELQQLQAKRKRDHLDFANRERERKEEWWGMVRDNIREKKSVNDMEVTCRKYRRVLTNEEQI